MAEVAKEWRVLGATGQKTCYYRFVGPEEGQRQQVLFGFAPREMAQIRTNAATWQEYARQFRARGCRLVELSHGPGARPRADD